MTISTVGVDETKIRNIYEAEVKTARQSMQKVLFAARLSIKCYLSKQKNVTLYRQTNTLSHLTHQKQ